MWSWNPWRVWVWVSVVFFPPCPPQPLAILEGDLEADLRLGRNPCLAATSETFRLPFNTSKVPGQDVGGDPI